jgi:hypothetical protein
MLSALKSVVACTSLWVAQIYGSNNGTNAKKQKGIKKRSKERRAVKGVEGKYGKI